jgi:hypothetical protein
MVSRADKSGDPTHPTSGCREALSLDDQLLAVGNARTLPHLTELLNRFKTLAEAV